VVVGMLDLRLMGRTRHLSFAAVHGLIPWGILGFVISLVTGAMFFIGAPDQYIDNPAWWYKLAFLAIARLNVLYFETTQARRALAVGSGDDTRVQGHRRRVGRIVVHGAVLGADAAVHRQRVLARPHRVTRSRLYGLQAHR
jgi:hypothetical protein